MKESGKIEGREERGGGLKKRGMVGWLAGWVGGREGGRTSPDA